MRVRSKKSFSVQMRLRRTLLLKITPCPFSLIAFSCIFSVTHRGQTEVPQGLQRHGMVVQRGKLIISSRIIFLPTANKLFHKIWWRPQILKYCGDKRLIRSMHVLIRPRLSSYSSIVPAKLQNLRPATVAARPSPSFTISSMGCEQLSIESRHKN